MLSSGAPVSLYCIGAAGARAGVLDYGCTLQSLIIQRPDGSPLDVCLGYTSAQGYEANSAHMGGTIGRVANRISKARFTLHGREYCLPANEGSACLHGGVQGFDRHFWRITPEGEDTLLCTRQSPDGEEGFPGNLDVALRLRLLPGPALFLEYSARCDRDTPLSLTNHSYFNLAGADDIKSHRLWIDADYYTEADASMCPTGRVLPVAGTALDFRREKVIGQDMDAGFDHNYVLRYTGLRTAARVWAPESGIGMDLITDAPCMQLYTAAFLKDEAGKGRRNTPYSGLCLETQAYVDAINRPEFPGGLLRAGEEFRSLTVYAFHCEKARGVS